MDKMLENARKQNNLDTGWKLAPQNDRKTDVKKETAETDSSVTSSPKSTSKHHHTMKPMGFEPTTSCMPCTNDEIL